MESKGKNERFARIRHGETGRFVIIPMDHGVSSGPIKGLVDMEGTLGKVVAGGATAVVTHKGIARIGVSKYSEDVGFILHLSASTKLSPDPNAKVLVACVEDALLLGCHAVSIHVNVGAATEKEMLQDLGFVSSTCMELGVPLLAMMYPRGPEITDPFDVELVKHVARIGAELGADIVKTNYTGTVDTFEEVTRGCPVPIVIAGGPKVDSDRDVLKMVSEAMEAGAKGISIGRNVFQHSDITAMTRAVADIVLRGKDPDEACDSISR